MNQRIIISVSNDVSTDQRVRKQCDSFRTAGFSVRVYCRSLKPSYPKETFAVRRFKLPFRKGALFYASFNIRLFVALLFADADVFYANDLDTLPANWLAALIRRKPLVYDSHEYFTEVPEIQHKPVVKAIWRFFEKICIHRPRLVITVSQSIAALLKENYGLTEVFVVRNIPAGHFVPEALSRKSLDVDEDVFLMVLQGAGINVDRGGEELIEAMQWVENTRLMIIGNGDALPKLRKMTEELDLSSKVSFSPRMAYSEMMARTAVADLGLSLDKPDNINYLYSLPNKIFDYARAGIPILASNLVEVEKLIREFEVGECIDVVKPGAIAAAVEALRKDPEKLGYFRRNTVRMNAALNWSNEFDPVIRKIKAFG